MKPILTFVCLAASAANAAIITYTDRNAFLAALSGAIYEESFAGIGADNLGVSSMNFSGNGLGYSISSTSNLFGTTIGGDRSMSTFTGTAPLTVGSFAGGVVAVGGYFYFDNGASGLSTSGAGPVTASNGIDANAIIQVGVASSLTNFVGFISSTPLVSVTFLRTSTNPQQFPNVDDLIVASAGAQGVPEPGTIALTVAGLAGLLTLRKRR